MLHMMAEKPLSAQEGSNTPNEAKNARILGIIEALKEHKINELKKLAIEMKMNFDDELYEQIENLKDSEIVMLTRFLLRWLNYPESSEVPHGYPQVLDIAEKITNNKYFRSHIKVANMFLNYGKYPIFNYNT